MKPFALLSMSTMLCTVAFATTELTPTSTYEVVSKFDRVAKPVTIYKFNPLRGVLKAIRVRFFHRLAGNLKYELTNPNNPAGASSWVGQYTATSRIGVEFPALIGTKTYTGPFTWSKKIRASKYDGVSDYAGTSGATVPITASGGGSENGEYSYRITDPNVLSRYVGLSVAIVNPLLPDILSGDITLTMTCSVGVGPMTWNGANAFPTPSILDLTGSRAIMGVVYEYTPLL